MPIDFPSNPTEGQILTSNTKSWVYTSGAWKTYNSISTVANTVVQQTTATGGQTLFTTPTYVQGLNQIRVFINGVRQNNVVDYAESSSNTITLVSAAAASDNVAFEVSTYAGTPVVIGYPTVIVDNTTGSRLPILFSSTNSGGLTVVNTDVVDLSFQPSTGTLKVGTVEFGDGTSQNTNALILAQAAYGKANAEGEINNTQNTNITNVNTFTQAAFNTANNGVTLANAAYAQANAAAIPTSINTRGLQAAASYFITFVDANNSTNAAETVHTHNNLNYNPSSGSLSANSLGIGTSASGTNGEIRATGDVIAFFSDERLKDILGTIPDPINKVMQISGVFFKNNDVANGYGYTKKHTQIGVIAQEIQKVLPDAIDLAPFDTEYDADENKYSRSGKYYLTVRHEKIIPLLIEAIKEQQKNIDILLENQKELSQEIERLKKET